MTPHEAHIVCPTNTEAVRVSASSRPFRSCTFVGVKSFDGAGRGIANTGSVFLGLSRQRLPIGVTTGKEIAVTAPPGVVYDLADFFILAATAGDGVAVFVTQ